MAQVLTSYGEIVDKYTILLLKQEKISDPQKLVNVQRELEELVPLINKLRPNIGLESLMDDLRTINESLWTIEDDIRFKERQNEFDAEFIELARSVYRTNDLRAKVKYAINQITHSTLCEEKSYS